MLDIEYSSRWDKDFERIKRRRKDLSKMYNLIEKLQRRERLDPWYRDHKLSGALDGFRECHIEPDWLLVYKVIKDKLILHLSRTGTHDEIF